MGSKGGTTVMLPQAQTQTSSVAPNPVALQAYSNVVGQAQGLQGQNLGFAPQQQQAFNEIGGLQGAANPYLQQAQNFIGGGVGAANQLIQSGANAGSPQNFGQNIQQYMNPYLNDVVRSTMANINETNAQQQSQLTGNAIAQGAMGGNRVGVAGAELARQQDLTNNSTLANILQAGYGQAGQNLFQGAGMQMQGGSALGGLGNQAGGLYAGLGSEAMSTGLQGANALLQAGGMQQALPYQQLAWLSGIVGNQGPLMGQTGTQSSMGYTSQYAPQPNMLNSILGAGVAGAGLLARARGGVVGKAHGGGLGEYDPSYDDYGAPIGGGFGAIPEVRPTGAHGLQLPQFQGLQQPHQQQQEQGRAPSFADFNRAGRGLGRAYDNNVETLAGGDLGRAGPGFADAAAEAEGEARGGRVRGYDDGGEVIDDTPSDEGRSTGDIGSVLREAHSDPVWQRIVQRESGGQHFNPDGTPKVGGAGEYGIAQIKPSTAQEALTSAGLPYDEARVKNDPTWNEGAGYLYYKNQRDRFGSPSLGAAAYNAGPTRLAQVLAGQGDIPASTRAYVADVTGQPAPGGLGAINAAAPVDEGRSADVGGVSPPNVPDAEPGFLERLGVPKISPDTKQALIAAGLGMMASKSHWLGPAIGEGGLQGIKTYYENQKNTRENALNQSTITNRAGLLSVAQQRTGILGQEAGTHATNVAGENRLRDAQIWLGQAGLVSMDFLPGVNGVGAIRVFDKNDVLRGGTGIRIIPLDQIPGIARPAAGAAQQPPLGSPQNLNPVTSPLKQTPLPTTPSPGPVAGQAPAAASPKQPSTDTQPERGAAGMMNWKPATSADAIPPNPDGTPYSPPRQLQTMMDPELKKKQIEELGKQLTPINEAVNKTGQALYSLNEMDRDMNDLPKTGLLAPGIGADFRNKIAMSANAFSNAVGITPFFDNSSTASLQQLKKDTFRLGSSLLKSDFGGGREAGMIIQQSVAATPGAENTLAGYKQISAGMREMQRYVADYGKFMNDYAGKFSNLQEADARFKELNPVEKYVDRARLATIDPHDLTGKDVKTKSGEIKHVPGLFEAPNNPQIRKALEAEYGKDSVNTALKYRPMTGGQ